MTEYIPVPADVPFGQQHAAPAAVVTRFAPSPNGNLHIGHALSAISAHDFARRHGGKFLLRIEDIDGTRSREEHIAAITADLRWLGLVCDDDIIYQSAHIAQYRTGLGRLREMGLIYRCTCTRSDIAAAIRARPVPHGPDGPVYPGTCRAAKAADDVPACWRLDMNAALALMPQPLVWYDLAAGIQTADPALFGDIILWRKDAPASYHLAATLDDHAAGISHVVRGHDLFAYTAVHILLQKLLGLLQPLYWHHPLIIDASGNKLGKSRGSPALSAMRAAGVGGTALAGDLRRGKLPLGLSLTTD
jgi:glutamyl-Q tRNA(Asp) synthetase